MKSSSKNFDYTINYSKLNLREHPELYRVGKGEQGVLLVQPYKAEILPFWRFKTPDIARESSEIIYHLFQQYKANQDFIGMDMARKFLQMGMTRSLRYYHHKSGKKYLGPVPADKKGQSGSHGRQAAPEEIDMQKKECADFFRHKYLLVMADEDYLQQKNDFRQKYG